MTPTNALTGRALDYAVGIAVNGVYTPKKTDKAAHWYWPHGGVVAHGYSRGLPNFSEDPRYMLKLELFAGDFRSERRGQVGVVFLGEREALGASLMQALCRAIVAREIGPAVEVPDEYEE